MGLFKKTFNSDKLSAMERTSLATELRIKETLGINRLEPMPMQAAQAFQLASNSKSTIKDFVKIIESDEVLSARIIKIANSVYFRRGEEAKEIEKAVANVGLNELRCLISATMLRSLLQGKQSVRELIWANSVSTAICCRTLAVRTNCGEGEAFLCGLLHDVGKLIMIRRNPRLYEKAISMLGGDFEKFISVEESLFDLNHIEVGKWIAERWNFPVSAIRTIAQHHLPFPKDEAQKGKNTSMSMLVKASDIIAHSLDIPFISTAYSFRNKAKELLPEAFKHLCIQEAERNGLLTQLQRKFNEEFALYQIEGS